MSLHPEVQKQAQAELDRVVGRERLADETDIGRTDLPYIAAVIKEVLRWGPPVPLGRARPMLCWATMLTCTYQACLTVQILTTSIVVTTLRKGPS
jgi:cytochrome P450